jgi:hypothetical protein
LSPFELASKTSYIEDKLLHPLLSSFMFYEDIDEGSIAYYKNTIKKGISTLHRSIDLLNFPGKYKNAFAYMKNRTKIILLSFDN